MLTRLWRKEQFIDPYTFIEGVITNENFLL